MKKDDLKKILEDCGQTYSEILGINVSRGKDEEVFKWFLASLLFGAPITESSAIKTYRTFERHRVLTPEQILRTGWDGLVKILDEGSYTRYDFKTADKLLEVTRTLTEKYGGRLNSIHAGATDADDLENRIKDLGKGIGDVTVSIFLRDLRGIWKKADPKPTRLVIDAAMDQGIVNRNATPEEARRKLKAFWAKNKVVGKSFTNFETALLRMGKDLRSRKRSAND